MKKVLLYSGGMDSWLIDKLWKPDIRLYVDMGTKYSKQEIANIKSKRSDVTFFSFPLGQWEREDSIIPLRNLYLPMIACNLTESEDVDICLGATAGDRVLDKSVQYADKATKLLNYLYSPQWWIPKGKRIRVNVDFKEYTKTDLLEAFIKQGGNINEAFDESFSCYHPDEMGCECWACKPCFRKFVAFERCGMTFSDKVLNKVIPYINKEIAPQIIRGTYGRGRDEENAIMQCLDKYKKCL